MKSKYIAQYYDAFARRYKNRNLLIFDRAAEYEFQRVYHCLDFRKKRTIVDLGCGVGKYALRLAKLGHTVTAVDISSESLTLIRHEAREHGIRTVKTVRHDFSTIKYRNVFDIGICISTYHAISEDEKVRKMILSNMIQSLKTGGTLLLVEPNPLNPLFYFFYLFFPGVQRENIRSFLGSSPFRLQRILLSLGMKHIRVRYVGFLPLRLLKRFPWVRYVNETVSKLPVLQYFSAFSYITAQK